MISPISCLSYRMSKTLIQFISHFPPSRGGLGEIAKEIAFYATQVLDYKVYNLVSSADQYIHAVTSENIIYFENQIVGYRKDGYEVLIIPSFDIIYNFPCPKFWNKKYRVIMKYLQEKVKNTNPIVQTHTRFFLRSLRGGVYSLRHDYTWTHVEHGSDYVKLNTWRKTWCARIWDEIFGRRILHKSRIIAISKRVQKFISHFTKHPSTLIYNAIDFKFSDKLSLPEIITIGFVGRLVKLKGVDILVDVFAKLKKKYHNLNLYIVGGGNEENNLHQQVKNLGITESVTFYGSRDREWIGSDFLPTVDIFVNPSFMEGFPTSVLEALLSECVTVATDVGGTAEISSYEDLILVKPWDKKDILRGLEFAIQNYSSLRWKSKQYIIDTFDWKIQIGKYEQMWNEIKK